MQNSHEGGTHTLIDTLLKAPRGEPLDVARPREPIRTIDALYQEHSENHAISASPRQSDPASRH